MATTQYNEYKQLDLPELDARIAAYWQARDIFRRSVEERDPDHAYVFYEGPPSANGMPGIHHVMARTVKDIFCRFHTMQGKRVERKAGWDTHGLPIELSVEKELGITKEDIGHSISVDDYNRQCRETVMRYKDRWDEITRRMGYWVDLENPYVTFENDYIESVWHLLRQLYDKGLLYKGYTVQPYSPAAGTGLSSHELNQPGCYRDVKDTTIVAQFRLLPQDNDVLLRDADGDTFFLAWTTTPWTLPSNTALAVGANIDYVLVKTFNPYTHVLVNVVLAEDLLGRWFKAEQAELPFDAYQAGDKKIPYRVLGRFKGSALVGLRYEQLMPYAQPEEGDAFRVIAGDFVSTEDGTGIVHIAPSFGQDDQRVARANGIGALTLVDKQGRFVPEVTDFAGRYVKDYRNEGEAYKDVDVDIAIKLKGENRAFNVQKYSHNYPHCWRTDKPVLFYPLDSWFIRATAAKTRMAELNRSINWKPAHTGTKRFGHWLDNLQDWNLSRSRYWGIPLPIWRSADASEEKCIGSLAELRAEVDKANAALGLQQQVPADLHRPYIDDIVLVGEQGQPLRRESDLIDVWFDSGAMPYAQWHFPFENEAQFRRNFPADFIAEGVDQTRGWFYTLHAIATMVFDSVAYKNVVSNGLVLDKEGRKMSKRLGNAVDPFQTIGTYGADATRWYMITNAQPWENLKFDIEGVDGVRRRFFGTLFNTYAFFALYANIDGFRYAEAPMPLAERPEIDRWIISLLHSLSQQVGAAYADYEPTTAGRLVQHFVDEHLSNWYVRLCRRRFWKGEYNADKIAAYQTLYECLTTLAKLMAPIAPFFSEQLYRDLNTVTGREAAESVHLALFPQAEAACIDSALEERMDYAQRIASLVLSLRKKEKLRVRQPLRKILLPVLNDTFRQQVDGVKDLVLAEVNVKALEYVDDDSGLLLKKAKANFKTLGRRLGSAMKAAASAIEAMTNADIRQLEREGRFPLAYEGQQIELTLEDVLISSEDIPGWQVASDGTLTVALDISLDDALRAEGMARELVNRIQNLRKQKDFNVTDRIRIHLERDAAIVPAVEQFGHYIQQEVLAEHLSWLADGEAGPDSIDPDERPLGIRVELA